MFCDCTYSPFEHRTYTQTDRMTIVTTTDQYKLVDLHGVHRHRQGRIALAEPHLISL